MDMCRNFLLLAAAFVRIITSIRGSSGEYGVEETKLKPFEKLLQTLEGKLMEGQIFKVGVGEGGKERGGGVGGGGRGSEGGGGREGGRGSVVAERSCFGC